MLLEHDIFKASSIAMVNNILGVEVMQELLELVNILQVGRIKLHFLLVAQIASSQLKNARTVAYFWFLLRQTDHLRYSLPVLFCFLLTLEEIKSRLLVLLIGFVDPECLSQSS